jgi:hypothetical protein
MWLNEAGGPPAGQVLPAGRDPRTRRRKRQAWTFTSLVTLVVVVGLVALGQAMRWWTIGGEHQRAARLPCPAQTSAQPDEVRLGVYNASSRFGLAREVARELQARGFTVTTVSNDPTGTPVRGTALVRFGAPGRLAAKSVGAQLAGPLQWVDDKRNSSAVDLVLGPGYQTMVPRPQASKAIAPVPTPTGCVLPTTPPATTPPPPTEAATAPASVPAATPSPPRQVLTPAPSTSPSPAPTST